MPFVRGMNYTSITSEEPVYKQSNSEWGSGRDIAYLVFSILQLITTRIGLVWTNWIVKKREEKHQNLRSEKEEREKKERLEREDREKQERLEREDREKQERLEREDREKQERLEREEKEKIAEIVSSEYTIIENAGVHKRLRQCKERFGSIIFCGTSCTVTGLDVLKYMLHPDKFKHFKDSKALQYLIQDLDLVVKLFQIFRIKLPPNVVCPEDIREELGPPVIELGQIASSLVTGKKYYTISKVLKYFDANQKTTSLGKQYQKDNQDIEKINANIPYIAYLRFGGMDSGPLNSVYGGSYDVTVDFELNQIERIFQGKPEQRQILSDLMSIGFALREEKPEDAEKLRIFASKIDVIWRSNFQELAMPDFSKKDELRANILHAVRVIWVKIVDGAAIDPFKELVKEMKKMTYVDADEAKTNWYKWQLKRRLESILQRLEKKQQTNLPGLENLDLILEKFEKILEKFEKIF